MIVNYPISSRSTELLREFSYLFILSSAEITHGIDDLAPCLTTMKRSEEIEQHAREINWLYYISNELPSSGVFGLFQSEDPLLIIRLKDI